MTTTAVPDEFSPPLKDAIEALTAGRLRLQLLLRTANGDSSTLVATGDLRELLAGLDRLAMALTGLRDASAERIVASVSSRA